jgi:hypothetical protein
VNLKTWMRPDQRFTPKQIGDLRKSHNLLVNQIHALLTKFRDACAPKGRWIGEDDTAIDGFNDEEIAPDEPNAFWEPYSEEEQSRQLQDIADKCDAIMEENA